MNRFLSEYLVDGMLFDDYLSSFADEQQKCRALMSLKHFIRLCKTRLSIGKISTISAHLVAIGHNSLVAQGHFYFNFDSPHLVEAKSIFPFKGRECGDLQLCHYDIRVCGLIMPRKRDKRKSQATTE